MPNVNTSFKLSTAREWMGTIYQDRNTAIAGELGKRAADGARSPSSVSRDGKPVETYQMQMVNDALLSPLLLQMAVFSAIDATERTVGASTHPRHRRDRIPERVRARCASTTCSPPTTAPPCRPRSPPPIPVAYVMQGGFDTLQLKRVAIKIEAFDQKKQLTIDGITASRREVRAGEKIQLNVTFTGENGAETIAPRRLPGAHRRRTRALSTSPSPTPTPPTSPISARCSPRPRARPAQLISTVNNLHPNTKAYIRVWRADPAFQLEGADLPDPPASVALILAGSQSSSAGITQTRNSKIARNGDRRRRHGRSPASKTVQVEIKE